MNLMKIISSGDGRPGAGKVKEKFESFMPWHEKEEGVGTLG